MTNEQCLKSLNSAGRKFLLDKREEYKDDKLLSKFLVSDKSDEYKYLIINLLETDYSKYTYDGSKKGRKRIYNKELAIKLNEINLKLNEIKNLIILS